MDARRNKIKENVTHRYPFDESFANRLAQLEAYNKHYYRPNTYLHKWWARRCGSTFRLILKGLVPEAANQDFYTAAGLAGQTILDPMMGGGTTLHEAIRLGAQVIGADLDPIPVLQARASLSVWPLPELEDAFAHFYHSLTTALNPHFETSVAGDLSEPFRFILYGMRATYANAPVLLVDSLTLRIETDGRVVHLCPHCHAILVDEQGHDCQPAAGQLPLYEKGRAWGRGRRSQVKTERDLPYWQRLVPLVVAVQPAGQRSLVFKQMEPADRSRLRQADDLRETLDFERAAFVVDNGRKSRQLQLSGIDNYLDLFSSRQLLYLHTARETLAQFEPLVRLNLALLVSTSLEFNSMLCGYKGRSKRRPGAVRHTFSHHAYSFPQTAVENNPLHPAKASGTLQRLFHTRIRNGRLWAMAPRERQFVEGAPNFVEITGEEDAGVEANDWAAMRQASTRTFRLLQGSSAHLDLPEQSVDHIVTDPPYYDSVQYSDLATFFRVWLKQFLPEADVDWGYDRGQSAVDPHKFDRESRYLEILGSIFSECRRVLKPDGRLIFTFHHWNPKGWAALTNALRRAQFQLVTHYVVYSESPLNVHIAGMKALQHDVIFVLKVGTGESDLAQQRPEPMAIATVDSEQFCRDCGQLLGWLLAQDLAETAVNEIWSQKLAGA